MYVTTLGNGIMESMAHLEKAVVAALGPRQHRRRTGDPLGKDRRTSEDARVRRPRMSLLLLAGSSAKQDVSTVLCGLGCN